MCSRISQLLLEDGDTDPSNSEHLTAAGPLWCDIFGSETAWQNKGAQMGTYPPEWCKSVQIDVSDGHWCQLS